MQEKQLQVIKLSDMTPTVNRRSGIEEKTVNLVVKENSVDLISVSSDDYKAAEEDEISFDEDRLQQWNFVEFRKQLLACVAGIVLCIGCGITSAWAVSDFIKDIQVNEAQWVDLDYNLELFNDDNDNEFLTSRHVIIAMVVLSFYVGCIIGAIFGAFVTPLLPNRAIYACCSVCMCFTGISLNNHTSPFYCAKSRLVTGFILGVIQVTLVIQAAESTTKKCRRWILIVVSYLSAFANLISSLIFHFYDDREEVSYTEENVALYIVSYVMVGFSLLALIVNFIFTADTVPFYLNRGEDTKAFKELSRLKSDHLSMLDIRYEYERIRFDVAQCQLDANRSLAARSSQVPLITMVFVRILNLLYVSVPMSLVLIWDPTSDPSEGESSTFQNNSSAKPTEDSEHINIDPLLTLSVLQACRLLCSIAVIIKQDKYHFNRFCYKLAFFVGATLIVWFIARAVLASIETIQNIIFFPVSIIIMMGFIGLPIPLDIIQLCQSADSYSRIKNTWSLAGAIFIENILHIFLIIQLDMIFGALFVFLVNGVAMMYFSFWLLKNMPNVVAIHPITVAIIARYPFKNANEPQTIHI